MNRGLFFVLSVAVLLSNVAVAQETLKKDTSISIQSVENYCTNQNIIGLGDYISLKINNLGRLVSSEKNQNNSLILYLKNIPMLGINPALIDTNKNLVVFPILRTDSSKQAWNIFYHKSARSSIKPVEVSVGVTEKGALKGNAGQILLKLYNRTLLWSMLVVFLFLVIIFVIFGKDMIRDGNLPKMNKKSKISNNSTFSMAKLQLAWWTFIIFGSIGYILLTTGELPIITGSTWILLAISIGTTAGAQIINFNAQNQVIKESKNWLSDILSDNEGINIHRFQMLIWTTFFGAYFVYRVYANLDIPQLSNEVLALMGISNGTYLGLKIPEDKKPANNDTKDKPDVPAVG
jgi:hypothetical protein